MKTLVLLWLGFVLRASGGLLPNGGFEDPGLGWNAFWSRDPGAGRTVWDTNVVHGGRAAMRIEHTGRQDWSLNTSQRLPVRPGEIYELAGWAKTSGAGDATLCVILYDGQGAALHWAYGAGEVRQASVWREVRTRFVIPTNAVSMLPRWIGTSPVTAWVDDTTLVRAGHVDDLRRPGMPSRLSLTNTTLAVTLNTADGAFEVCDQRTGHTWTQRVVESGVVLREARHEGNDLELRLLHIPSGIDLEAKLSLDGNLPELVVGLREKGRLTTPVNYPHPFVTSAGTHLIVPMNEGISYPVEDVSIAPMRLIAYGGHGICMAFWGVTDGETAQMTILETADDASIRIGRTEGRLYIAPEWDPQKQAFGYPRRLRYVFLDRGGHVAICKRYRAYAQNQGRFKTLAEKRAQNPQVDRLIGAVNVWCWDRDAVPLVREMQSLGIDRILWSNRQSPENLRRLNELEGVLTSRYDIYQDIMDPANFQHLHGVHSDWVTEAWPQDVIRNAAGDWLRGWEVKGTNGVWYPCGVICDRQALPYASRRIPAELDTHPYHCRFIDTTTAAPWNECYHPEHPMTRSESRHWKMELLRYVSESARLVTGCETGHDAAVPFLHYFEGMLSLGPYRVPDAGRDMLRIWEEVPEEVAKFQLGHRYRLPLWELVYHDCVVAQWYWGDYNNKLPALWDKRDRFNLLYGTPPMFMFDRPMWEKLKTRFARSYRDICPTVRRVGYAEMTDHRFLTPNRDVQQTVFANGETITVNFGDAEYKPASGPTIPAMGFAVENRP